MAQIDASIPLSFRGGQQPDLLQKTAEALSIKSAMDEQKQREEQRQQQMSLREAFSTADMDTPEGRQDLIRKAGAINPSVAMQLSQHFSLQETQRVQRDHAIAAATEAQLKTNIERLNLKGQLAEPILDRRAELIKKGNTEQEADAAITPMYNQAVMTYAKVNGMNDQQIAQYLQQNPYNYQKLTADLAHSKAGKEKMELELKTRKEELAEQRAEEQQRHNLASEERMAKMASIAAQKAQGNPNAELDKDTLTQMAQQYLAGDNSVKQGLGYGVQGSKNRVNLQKAIQEEARKAGMSPQDVATSIAEFQGLKAGERTLATRAAQASMAVNEANNMADLVTDASSKVSRTNFIPANIAILAYQKNTGDPEVVKYGAAINSFINAYARAISPTGQPTVSDKDHGREMLEAAQSHKQVVATIEQMKKEMAAAKEAPAQSKQELRNLAGGKKEEKPKQEAPAGAIDYLKAHPELKDQFKAKYGYLPEGM